MMVIMKTQAGIWNAHMPAGEVGGSFMGVV
jgi:hypothetical protein